MVRYARHQASGRIELAADALGDGLQVVCHTKSSTVDGKDHKTTAAFNRHVQCDTAARRKRGIKVELPQKRCKLVHAGEPHRKRMAISQRFERLIVRRLKRYYRIGSKISRRVFFRTPKFGCFSKINSWLGIPRWFCAKIPFLSKCMR